MTLSLAAGVAACGEDASEGGPASGGPTKQQPQSITFEFGFLPTALVAPIYYAEAQGYYRDVGLDVKLVVGKTSNLTVQNVNTGNADLAWANSASLVQGVGKGADVISVMSYQGTGSYGFLMADDAGLASLKDMETKGATVLVGGGASPQATMLPALYKANGIDPKKIKLAALDPSAYIQAYADGRGDVLASGLPLIEVLVGGIRASTGLLWADAGLSVPDYSIVTSGDFMKGNPEAVTKFITATAKGVAESIRNPQAAIDALKKGAPAIDAKVQLEVFDKYVPLFCPPNFDSKSYGLHAEADWAKAIEVLEAGDPGSAAGKFFTDEFVKDTPACPLAP